MAVMTWDNSLTLGHPKIDKDHEELVATLNALHQAMKVGRGRDEITRTLQFLRDYTVKHFRAEEDLMCLHRFPGTQMHMAIHADLVKQVADLVGKFEAGQAVLTMQVMDFLEKWLKDHILGEDRILADYLNKRS
jgi:hemerythrin-like metal-binding protein